MIAANTSTRGVNYASKMKQEIKGEKNHECVWLCDNILSLTGKIPNGKEKVEGKRDRCKYLYALTNILRDKHREKRR